MTQGWRAGEDWGGVRGGHGEGERHRRGEGGRSQRVHQAEGQWSINLFLLLIDNENIY